MYSRMDQVNLFTGCLPQILLGPILKYFDPYVTKLSTETENWN